ncbi:MAG: DUF4249 domain-containing protein [Flavisolibacter sp.]
MILPLVFLSCKKVIDLNLQESEKKYVVEGVITNEPGVCKVHLSQTIGFDEDNIFPGVSGAIVKVKDNGVEFTLMETQTGTYQTNLVNGTPGHTYQLSVSVAGQVFTATCTMPQPVLMDTLYISRGPFGQFKFATVGYTDPAGVDNGYRFVQYVNGLKDPTIFWEDDEFTDGQYVLNLLDTGVDKKDDPHNINSGDVVTLEMLCVDEAVLRYWYTLQFSGGDGSSNTAAPSNPLTNIQGGALGYFSAHTIDRRTVIAP